MSFIHENLKNIRNAKTKELKEILLKCTPGEIEAIADSGLRHGRYEWVDKEKTKRRYVASEPHDYLFHWLKITRCFAYATQDDSWGELEKHIPIIIKRLVVAERNLRLLGIEDLDDDI